MMVPWVTPEYMAQVMAAHKKAVAALTPEEKVWLSAEEDWKYTVARQEEEARYPAHAELATLLEEDIRAYGQPAD